MFRKLTRSKQALTEEECVELLKETKRGVLSVLGDGGYPYGIPMDHYYCEEDGKIYFHSGKTGHKTDAMRACPKVSYCVIDDGTPTDTWALDFRSVVVFGKAEFIDDPALVREMSRRLSYKFTSDESYIENEIARFEKATLLFAITPENITGKRVNEA